MRTTIVTILAVTSLAAALGGCGSGNSLTTGSLFGSGSGPDQPVAPKPITPSERALYVGANVARAQRCGFFFNAEEVKANYLASEQEAGTAPDVVAKVTKEFDFTRQSVLAAAAKDDTYCTEGRNREVKAALTRQLAGDFSPPRVREDVNISLFDHQKRNQPLNGERIFDASQRKAGPVNRD